MARKPKEYTDSNLDKDIKRGKILPNHAKDSSFIDSYKKNKEVRDSYKFDPEGTFRNNRSSLAQRIVGQSSLLSGLVSDNIPNSWDRNLKKNVGSINTIQPFKAINILKTEVIIMASVLSRIQKSADANEKHLNEVSDSLDKNNKDTKAIKNDVRSIYTKIDNQEQTLRNMDNTIERMKGDSRRIEGRLSRLEATVQTLKYGKNSSYVAGSQKASGTTNNNSGSLLDAAAGYGLMRGVGGALRGIGGTLARFAMNPLTLGIAATGTAAYMAYKHVQGKQDRQAQGLPRNLESDEQLSKGLESGWGSRANRIGRTGNGSPGQGRASTNAPPRAQYIRDNLTNTIDDRIYRDRIDREKSQFMQFGAMPGGFEFIQGHRGRLGSPAAVAATGAMPLTGISGMGGSSGGYSGQYRSPGFRRGGYAGPQSEPYSSGGRQGGYGGASSNYPNDNRPDSRSSRQSQEQYWGTPGNRGTTGISDGTVKPYVEGFAREQFDSQLDESTKQKLYALTLAEVGDKDPAAQRALMETIVNRNQAHGHKNLNQTMSYGYYEPFQNGKYEENLQRLKNNPELAKQLEQRWQEVRAGSNDSNYGLHNSSAGVAASARETQHISAVVGGETFSRKTNSAYTGMHGEGIYTQETSWLEKTQEAVANAARNKSGQTQNDRLPPLATISKEALLGGQSFGVDKFGSMSNRPGMSIPEIRKGAEGEFNYALSSEGAQEFGEPSSNLRTVPITTKDGRKAFVHPQAQQRFQSFIDAAQSRGYQINDIGGYNYRNKVGGSGLSTHATGTTIDLNASKNWIGSNKTDMPHNMEKLGWLHGLSWGARFNDAMHFEVMSPQLRQQRLQQLVKEGFITPDDVDYINKNGVPPPHLVNPSNAVPQNASPVIANSSVDMSKRGITSGMKKPNSERQRNISWSSLERPPTKEEIDNSMKNGIKYFDFDTSQPGGKEAADYVNSKKGEVITYNNGPGNPSWNEPYRPPAQVLEEAKAASGKYIHLDNFDKYSNSEKTRIIDDMKSIGKVVIPKNAPEFWAKYLEQNPDYAKNLPLGYIENMSKMGSEERAFATKLDKLIPGGLTNMEWPSETDPNKIKTVAQSTGIPTSLISGPERPDAAGNGGYHAPIGTPMLNAPAPATPAMPEKLKTRLDMPKGANDNSAIGQQGLVSGIDLADSYDPGSSQQNKMPAKANVDATPVNPDIQQELNDLPTPVEAAPEPLPPPEAPAPAQTQTAPQEATSEPSSGAVQRPPSQAPSATEGGVHGGSGRHNPETRGAEPGSGGRGSQGRCFL